MEKRQEFFGIPAGLMCQTYLHIDAYKGMVAEKAGVNVNSQFVALMNEAEAVEDVLDALNAEDAQKVRNYVRTMVALFNLDGMLSTADEETLNKMIEEEAEEVKKQLEQ